MAEKIYIADQRGVQENPNQRIISTFNYEHYYHEHKTSIGNLYLLNECALAKNQEFLYLASPRTQHLIIPLVGNLICTTAEKSKEINIGEVLYVFTDIAAELNIRGAEPDEPNTFIHIGICGGSYTSIEPLNPIIWQIPLASKKNVWIVPTNALAELNFHFSIGVFSPTKDDLYFYRDHHFHHCFAFTLEGAVEIEDRLLYEGDGLLLSPYTLVFEALSTYSIFFVLEF